VPERLLRAPLAGRPWPACRTGIETLEIFDRRLHDVQELSRQRVR